jgi:uncharacterized protein YeaO (DUF488 family)
MAKIIKIKRVYAPPSPVDGKRILIDRLWPRGVSKSTARIDVWLKDIAPSNQLRTWFNHDPDKWTEFAKRYRRELLEKANVLQDLRAEAGKGVITLLFAAKDEEHNNAVVLRDLLTRKKQREE